MKRTREPSPSYSHKRREEPDYKRRRSSPHRDHHHSSSSSHRPSPPRHHPRVDDRDYRRSSSSSSRNDYRPSSSSSSHKNPSSQPAPPKPPHTPNDKSDHAPPRHNDAPKSSPQTSAPSSTSTRGSPRGRGTPRGRGGARGGRGGMGAPRGGRGGTRGGRGSSRGGSDRGGRGRGRGGNKPRRATGNKGDFKPRDKKIEAWNESMEMLIETAADDFRLKEYTGSRYFQQKGKKMFILMNEKAPSFADKPQDDSSKLAQQLLNARGHCLRTLEDNLVKYIAEKLTAKIEKEGDKIQAIRAKVLLGDVLWNGDSCGSRFTNVTLGFGSIVDPVSGLIRTVLRNFYNSLPDVQVHKLESLLQATSSSEKPPVVTERLGMFLTDSLHPDPQFRLRVQCELIPQEINPDICKLAIRKVEKYDKEKLYCFTFLRPKEYQDVPSVDESSIKPPFSLRFHMTAIMKPPVEQDNSEEFQKELNQTIAAMLYIRSKSTPTCTFASRFRLLSVRHKQSITHTTPEGLQVKITKNLQHDIIQSTNRHEVTFTYQPLKDLKHAGKEKWVQDKALVGTHVSGMMKQIYALVDKIEAPSA